MVIDEYEGVYITYSEFAEGNWEVKGDVVIQPKMPGINIQLNTKYKRLVGFRTPPRTATRLIMSTTANLNSVKQFFSIILMVQIDVSR